MAAWAQGYALGLCDMPPSIQVKIPIKEEEEDVFSPMPVTYSSSLQRSSPRTISFRVSPGHQRTSQGSWRPSQHRDPAQTPGEPCA